MTNNETTKEIQVNNAGDLDFSSTLKVVRRGQNLYLFWVKSQWSLVTWIGCGEWEESRLSLIVDEVQEWEILTIFGDLWKYFMQKDDVVTAGLKKINLDSYGSGTVKPESWQFCYLG